MDKERELEHIKTKGLLKPRIYSFEEVRELVLFAEKKLLKQYTTKDKETFMDKVIKEFRDEVGKELGYISGVFMSQGKTKAEDIIMPTEELEEA